MDPHKNLEELVSEALDLKNLNHKKLSELTGVSERYIWAIQNMEIDKLPPAPYVRGYIKRISNVLHINHDELWELYKKELEHKKSGAYDKLPDNRFAIKHLPKNKILLIVLGFLLILYLIFNAGRILGEAELSVTNPNVPTISTYENSFTVTGKTEQRNKLTMNGYEVFVNDDGTFSRNFTLQPGLNMIEIKAKKLLGREKVVIRKILYQPTTDQQQTTNN